MIQTKKNRSKKMLKRTLANLLKAKTNCCKKAPVILIVCPDCDATIRVEE